MPLFVLLCGPKIRNKYLVSSIVFYPFPKIWDPIGQNRKLKNIFFFPAKLCFLALAEQSDVRNCTVHKIYRKFLHLATRVIFH